MANRVPDPYKEGDPIHDPAFKKEYLHVDGSINEKVLIMLQKYQPAPSGAMNGFVGFMLFMFVFAAILYCYMAQNGCWSPRDNEHTRRLEAGRRAEYDAKLDREREMQQGHV